MIRHMSFKTISAGLSATVLVAIAFMLYSAMHTDSKLQVAYEARPAMELDEEESTEGVFTASADGRSSHWPTVMHHFKHNERYDGQHWVFVNDGIDRSCCRCCGSRENLNVHHIKPFHIDPALELDFDNLVTLCREHHFHIGHKDNWKNSNPNVCADCDKMRAKLNPR